MVHSHIASYGVLVSVTRACCFARNLVLPLFLGSFISHFTGCSTTSSPNYAALGLVQISGAITVDGAPLSNARVRLETTEDATYSEGITNVSGRYSMIFDSDTAGVIPGKKRVILLPGGTAKEESSDEDPDQGVDSTSVQTAGVAIPKCYGPDSKVMVEVTKSDSSFNIDFRSDCSTVGR